MVQQEQRTTTSSKESQCHEVGDYILLSTSEIGMKTHPPKIVGPFQIVEHISTDLFKIHVPEWSKAHYIIEGSKLITFHKYSAVNGNKPTESGWKPGLVAKLKDPGEEIGGILMDVDSPGENLTVPNHLKKKLFNGEHPNKGLREVNENPSPVIDDEEYEVEAILDERIVIMENGRERKEFLVKWKGYSNSENSWEPRKNLTHARRMLDEFTKKKKSKRC